MALPRTEINETTLGYEDLEEIRIPEGYVRFREWPDMNGPLIEYRAIWVNEDKRRKGFGKKLIKMLAKEVKKRGFKEIYVRANTDGSDDFGKWLTAVGFRPTYEIEGEEETLGGGSERRMSFLGHRMVWRNLIDADRNNRYGFNFKKKL